ncbi:MAG TPA: NTP transferase domain-containing protein [Acidimicrobiales bacterium]|nr:NTP transferase domain-containing protein [Acidimicrobiales bacterium]
MSGTAGDPRPSALLLTGGASRRMGRDKAAIAVDGRPGAVRIAELLTRVADPAIEVGPGRSGLAAVTEEEPGGGPLAAVAAGAAELGRRGHRGPALLVACDLPRLHSLILGLLAGWPGDESVVPVVEGRPQWLCARVGVSALAGVGRQVAAGERRLAALFDLGPVELVDEHGWGGVAEASDFADIDEPSDLVRLGLAAPGARLEGGW